MSVIEHANGLSADFDESSEMFLDYYGDKSKEEVQHYLDSKWFIYRSEEDYLKEIYGN